jgi:hypothetical protein
MIDLYDALIIAPVEGDARSPPPAPLRRFEGIGMSDGGKIARGKAARLTRLRDALASGRKRGAEA